ncbi:MAG: hypothetical protein RIQ51_1793 [Bacteroidota bacterium]
MLDYSEITVRKYIILEGEPYEVIDNHIFRMQQRKPQNKTKTTRKGRYMTKKQGSAQEELSEISEQIDDLYAKATAA